MSKLTQNIKSYKTVYPQIYSYILPELPKNEGSQKIGYTERKNVADRIKQQVETAAIKLKYELKWSAPAFFEGNEESFTDKLFHKFLEKKGIERKLELGQEWFYFNGESLKSKDLFDLFRKEKFAALQKNGEKLEYNLRFEQEEAVKKALEYFQNNKNGEFLWNAKPRFGKTLASYDLAKQLKANKVLIVTNRPAIANAWFDDYENFVDGYAFISETQSLKNRATLTREQHIAIKPIKPLITFLSLQDLKGSKYFGGNYDKLRWVADLEWDLLIIDEAHEGVDTGRTDAAFDVIKRKNTLHLSGTPFKALANEKFSKEAIYNWTYLDEQKIKQIEIEEGETGDHTDLPDLKLFTYRISQMTTNEVNEGIDIENENRDYAFDLNEFFRTHNKKFVHEKEVIEFLKNLSTNKKYPFSTPELRAELKHTFWYVGNRVESVKALEKLLKEDPVFKDYKVIVAAGDGKTFEEEENDYKGNESSFQKVKKAIREHDKTITLSCGQLTTGVTIKEWTAVLMLTDIKTPALYMQAAFRAQNPFKEWRNGELFAKKTAYLFDFAPTRVLEIYDQFANGLNPKAVKGEITEKDREENIKELLNFFPVISEDVNGEMIELDAQKVLTFPNALAAAEIVKAQFMTNLLFNDSLKGVFSFPKEVEEILDKLPEEKNKRVQTANTKLNLDDAKKTNDQKAIKINENTQIILGEKIFKINTERVIDNLLELNTAQIETEDLVKDVMEVAEPLVAKYKEVYKTTQAETNEATKQIQEKVKQIAEEYNNAEIDSKVLKQKLIDAIERDFVQEKVAQKEEETVQKVQKTKEEEIKDRLRSFTRTIPMFIMANDSKDEITIDNFDLEIDDNDFLELTSITKAEFHTLRDGFDYEEDGERKTFSGVFNKYRFNASIAEFRLKKDQLANYFTAEEDIFELIPNQKTNQIFTPRKVVQMMINQLEQHDPSLFTRTDSTFIDLYMKSGMYITEIVKKLYYYTRKHYKSDEDCLKHILENQVHGLAPTPILQGITQSYIFGFDVERNISRKNFVQHDITPEAQAGTAKQKLQQLFNLNNMKFDAVVGNPPYQDNDGSGGQGSSAMPIYNHFVNSAKEINPRIINLIMPTRWYAGGKGLDDFRKQMLDDKHIVEIHDFLNPNIIFPTTNIRGGVCFVLWNNNYNNEKDLVKVVSYGDSLTDKKELKRKLKFDGEDIFIRHIESLEIVKKVKSQKGFTSFEKYVSSRKPFGLDSKFDRTEDFYNTKDGLKDPIICYAKRQEIGYVDNDKFNFDKKRLNSYKVFTSFANNIGTELNDDNLNTFIGQPKTICTETYIILGDGLDVNQVVAENISKYFKTKFARFLHGIAKSNQNGTAKTYKFVPLQDFTENSDIDWSKSIPEIDQQLYKKYGLSEEEIAFIESKIKPMD